MQGKEQGNGSQSLFSAGKLHHILQLLSGRLGNNGNTAFQQILAVIYFDFSASSSKEYTENLIKALLNLMEVFVELLSHPAVQVLNNLSKRFLRADQVFHLFP